MNFYVDGPVTTGSIPTAVLFQTGTTPLNKAERLRISSNGNIGVGNSSPAQKLEVNGGVRLNTASAKPVTCDATARGTFWFDQTGADDAVYVCARIGGVFAWKKVTLQ